MAAYSSFQRAGERRGRWGSPERTVVWTEPKPKQTTRKVAVVYYLCHRDGHLDHPHFLEMELPVSSCHSHHRAPPGLFLRDFTARLNALRGSGMASLYSWSSKRSYRSGYVWQDLAEDNLIHPAHANDEYVLKGSPLILLPQLLPPSSSSTTRHHDDSSAFSSSSDFSIHQDRIRAGGRRKNWSSFDLGDRGYNNKPVAATQSAGTDDHRGPEPEQLDADTSAELGTDEISPPPSSSSSDDALQDSCSREVVGVMAGGRMRASAVLMQFFSCGSMATVKRPGHAHRRSDLTMSGSSRQQQVDKEAEAADDASAGAECLSGGAGVGTGSSMERDYFSGSLVESGKTCGGGDGALLLKRSSSCNAFRGAVKLKLKLPVSANEAHAGCLASRAGRLSKKNMTRCTSTMAETESKIDGGECKGAVEPTTADKATGSS